MSNQNNPAAVPQPAPRPSGVNVQEQVLEDMRQMIQNSVRDQIIEDIKARMEFGIQKYGQPLMSNDGRDDGWEAYQEVLDLMMYARKGVINGRPYFGYVYREARRLAFALRKMLNESES